MAVGNSNKVQIELTVDDHGSVKVKQFGQELETAGKKGEKAFDGLKDSLAGIGTAIAAYFTADLFGSMIKSAMEAERGQARLEAAIRSTGGAAGLSSEQLNQMAADLAAVTTAEDDAITSAQAILLTFKNIRGDMFRDVTEAALDMSAQMNDGNMSAETLKNTMVMLGKAMNDPAEGLSALTRNGVTFNDAQKDVIKGLVESGKVMEAQQMVLAELNSEFGGTARAIADTFGGKWEQAVNAAGNLGEAIGGLFIGSEGLNNLLPQITLAIHELESGIKKAQPYFDKFMKFLYPFLYEDENDTNTFRGKIQGLEKLKKAFVETETGMTKLSEEEIKKREKAASDEWKFLNDLAQKRGDAIADYMKEEERVRKEAADEAAEYEKDKWKVLNEQAMELGDQIAKDAEALRNRTRQEIAGETTDFTQGMKLALEDMTDPNSGAFAKFGELGFDMMNDSYQDMVSLTKDILVQGITGNLNDLQGTFEKFGEAILNNFLNVLAQMVTQTLIAKALIDTSLGASLGLNMAGATATGAAGGSLGSLFGAGAGAGAGVGAGAAGGLPITGSGSVVAGGSAAGAGKSVLFGGGGAGSGAGLAGSASAAALAYYMYDQQQKGNTFNAVMPGWSTDIPLSPGWFVKQGGGALKKVNDVWDDINPFSRGNNRPRTASEQKEVEAFYAARGTTETDVVNKSLNNLQGEGVTINLNVNGVVTTNDVDTWLSDAVEKVNRSRTGYGVTTKSGITAGIA